VPATAAARRPSSTRSAAWLSRTQLERTQHLAEAHSRIVPLRRSFQGGWEALGPNAEGLSRL
jgi:hypothetical protein